MKTTSETCVLQANFRTILDDPVKLGAFLSDASEIAELAKVARTHAIALLLLGTKIPGWILRRRENSFVLPKSLAPLATESLPTILSVIGTISESRYRALCAKCGVEPDPAAIIKAGTTVYLSASKTFDC
jgi:hypothetical protein